RMATAGSDREIFDADALREVHRLSSGVPSQINAICARALLGAVAHQRRGVDRMTVRAAGRSTPAPPRAPVITVPERAPRIEPVRAPRRRAPRQRARSTTSRARRRRWAWLVSGGLAVSATVIAAVLLAPHPSGVAPAPTEPRAETEMEAPAVESAA